MDGFPGCSGHSVTNGHVPIMALEPSSWTTADVGKWLSESGFSDLAPLFLKHEIDGEVLLQMTEADLKRKPLKLEKLGECKKLSQKIETLKALKQPRYGDKLGRDGKWQNDGETILSASSKLIFAVAYLTLASFVTSLVMTIAHVHLPDPKTFPPLPDFVSHLLLVLIIPSVCEWIASTWSFFFFALLIFHRHRVIVLRRVCVVVGSLFLLRSLTMFVTSMSVPAAHLGCDALNIDGKDVDAIINHAWFITTGLGMSINGVRTCGDYMFSGHTLILTILNLAMIEYTPHHWRGFHILSWLANAFGMFFILAAHEHYTIDVVISFLISSRMWQYYHTMTHINRTKDCSFLGASPASLPCRPAPSPSSVFVAHELTMSLESEKRRLHFDYFVFSYMEEDIHGVLPNVYEWPWEAVANFIRHLSAEITVLRRTKVLVI